MQPTIQFGADRLADDPGLFSENRFHTGQWGLLTNDAARSAVDPARHSRVDLLETGIEIVRLFSPEHGIDTAGPDGQAIGNRLDSVTGLEVCSLYGQKLKPTPQDFAGLDGLLIDLPDAGVRFYTYLWTISYLMEAACEAGLPVVVLDRPNPLGGRFADVEGPLLDTNCCSSFLGRAPMPVRHSLTPGESACWLASVLDLQELQLQVIPMDGWTRFMLWPETGLAFVPPSPGLPQFESLLCYPGISFFEATNLSLGRGTKKPFRQLGAPWMDPDRLLDALETFPALLRGVRFEPVRFSPSIPPCKNRDCRGVYLDVTDRKQFKPVQTGLLLLGLTARNHPEEFRWSTYPTAANPSGRGHFERLAGRKELAGIIQYGQDNWIESLTNLLATPDWHDSVSPHLIYN